MKYDIVLSTIPKNEPNSPYPGPFVLKSALLKAGFSCFVYDFNKIMYNKIKNKEDFSIKSRLFLKKDLFEKIWDEEFKTICLEWIEELKTIDTKWFGYSLLSYHNLFMAKKIIPLIKKEIPYLKIIVGGSLLNSMEFEISAYLGDVVIYGNGEKSLVELLKGNDNYPGININNSIQTDINSVPIPNYDDILHLDYNFFYVMQARGCVNICKFCHETRLNKFQQRNVYNTMTEVYRVNEIKDIKFFFIADSLMNGNKKIFLEFVEQMKKNDFEYYGYFLISSWMTEQHFKDVYDSGLRTAWLGPESGSDRIKKDMGKSFTTEMILHHIKYFNKYQIKTQLSFIVGWPSETESEFQETLQLLTDISQYRDTVVISLCNPAYISKELTNVIEQYDIKYDDNDEWYYKDNNMDLRNERYHRFVEKCEELNITKTFYFRSKSVELEFK